MYLLFEMVFLCSLGYPGALIAQFHSPRCCNYRYCHYRALKWVATLTHTQNWGWKLSLGHARQVYCPELSPPYLFFFSPYLFLMLHAFETLKPSSIDRQLVCALVSLLQSFGCQSMGFSIPPNSLLQPPEGQHICVGTHGSREDGIRTWFSLLGKGSDIEPHPISYLRV